MNHKQQRAALRQHYRKLRRELGSRQQAVAADQLAALITTHKPFIEARNMTAYLADQGEMNLAPVIQLAWSLQKNIFLPAIDSSHVMRFVPYQKGDKLVEGYYGIDVPAGNPQPVSPASLDLILAPLVAFDASGNRLGQGGGYYDRFLASLSTGRQTAPQQQKAPRRPFILGIAHSCQQARQLPVESWDIPLDAVATDTGIMDFA